MSPVWCHKGGVDNLPGRFMRWQWWWRSLPGVSMSSMATLLSLLLTTVINTTKAKAVSREMKILFSGFFNFSSTNSKLLHWSEK